MIVKYDTTSTKLEVGHPYTIGDSGEWFIRINSFMVIRLEAKQGCNSVILPARTSQTHISCATSWPNFRYATSMEIND